MSVRLFFQKEEINMKRICILGSTGSIGRQTCEVCREHELSIVSAAAHRNIRLLEREAREFKMKKVCVYEKKLYNDLKLSLSDTNVKVLAGTDGLCELSEDDESDFLVNSVVGMVGLLPTLKAIDAGKTIALANKETLVAGGHLVMKKAAEKGVKIYPIDSEHSAVFQCLNGENRGELKSIILTASGGPFFGKKKTELQNVTVSEALAHPNWSMGNKITIDSATMMNKGLEFIEAKWLFGLTDSQINIVIHRQSVVHSAVEFADGAVIAEMGVPDMKIPIQYALLYPERAETGVKRLSLTNFGTLTFEKPDFETFDCLSACINAARAGKDRPVIVNGANEVAVSLFLQEKIPFLKIGELVRKAAETLPETDVNTYDGVCEADNAAREFVRNEVRV